MNPKDKALKDANKALNAALEYIRRQEMVKVDGELYKIGDSKRIAKEVADAVAEAIDSRVSRIQPPQIDTSALVDAIKQIQVAAPNVYVDAPVMPDIVIPEQKTPQISVKVPKSDDVTKELKAINKAISEQKPIDIPKQTEYTLEKPMPVLIADETGKPWSPFGSGRGGGGVTSLRYIDSTGKERIVSDEFPIPTDASLSINSTLDVRQVSGSIDSVYVTGAAASTYAEIMNPDGRVKVELPTGSSGLTDAELRATAVPVTQVSGASWSTEATQSGTWNIGTVTAVTGVTNSIAVSTLPETIQTQLDAIQSAVEQDNKAFEVRQTSGFTDSVFVTGFADSVTVYQARTTNPTAKSDGADVRPSTDHLARTITTPIQMRGLRATAYVALANGTETTLLAAGGAGVYHDCIMITATNNSSAAVQLDIRAVTGGNIVHTMYLPATTGPVGWAPAVPWPQDNVNNNWTIDMPDITGTTVYVSGLFSKEV